MTTEIKTIPNGFDYFGLPEEPTIILCNPNKQPICSLYGITDRQLELNLNALSTFSFKATERIDNQPEYFTNLISKKLVLIDEIGYFIISEIKTDNDGITETKTVTAQSLEAELCNRKSKLISGTYKFYDLVTPQESLLGILLQAVPNWSIGNIDTELMNKWRYFELSEDSIYNVLMTTISETFECVFVFDTFERTISAYTAENVITPTSIYLSHDNLIQESEINELSDELFTCMSVTGGNDLSISYVNPLGDNKIYNFSHYKTPEWMSEELIKAIDKWETVYSEFLPRHQELVQIYYYAYERLEGQADNPDDSGLYGQRMHLKEDLSDQEEVKGVRIEQGIDYSEINKKIKEIKAELEVIRVQIDEQEAKIADARKNLNDIAKWLSFENMFTPEQYKELSTYIYETSYSNENYIQLDTMRVPEILNQAKQLFEQSQKVLDRICQPRYEFTLQSSNFIFLKEFKEFSRQLKLGSEVTAELSENTLYKPILLQIQLNYDKMNQFSMSFGNRLRLDSNEFIFSDLFGEAIKTSQTVSLNSTQWNSWAKNYKSKVTEFMTSSLDASKNAIVSSDKQSFTMDRVGIRGREVKEDGSFGNKQLWMNNSMLAFTDDNWETSKLALGEFTFNGQSVYGLIGEAIVGKLLVGDSLTIANENNSFVVDASGATLSDASFTLTNTTGVNKILMTPDDGFKIQKGDGENHWTDMFYLDENGNIVMKGTIDATGGIFRGDVQAQRYLDASGADMFKDGKFQSEYLELKGLNINNNFIVDSDGNVTINNGTISWDSITGTDDLDDRLDDIENSIPTLPSYIKSTKITSTTIESPTIKAGEFYGATYYDDKNVASLTLSGGSGWADLTYTKLSESTPLFKIRDDGVEVSVLLGNKVGMFYNKATKNIVIPSNVRLESSAVFG